MQQAEGGVCWAPPWQVTLVKAQGLREPGLGWTLGSSLAVCPVTWGGHVPSDLRICNDRGHFSNTTGPLGSQPQQGTWQKGWGQVRGPEQLCPVVSMARSQPVPLPLTCLSAVPAHPQFLEHTCAPAQCGIPPRELMVHVGVYKCPSTRTPSEQSQHLGLGQVMWVKRAGWMGVWGWGQAAQRTGVGPARDGRAGWGSGLSWELGPQGGRGGDEVMEVRHCGVGQGTQRRPSPGCPCQEGRGLLFLWRPHYLPWGCGSESLGLRS